MHKTIHFGTIYNSKTLEMTQMLSTGDQMTAHVSAEHCATVKGWDRCLHALVQGRLLRGAGNDTKERTCPAQTGVHWQQSWGAGEEGARRGVGAVRKAEGTEPDRSLQGLVSTAATAPGSLTSSDFLLC